MRRGGAAGFAWVVLVTLLVLGRASAAEDELPNLVPIPPYDVGIGTPDNWLNDPTLPPVLRFTSSTANRSIYPLELIGIPKSATAADGEQCVQWDSGICQERRSVGEVVLHLEHQHWHYQGFARYSLRRLVNGVPDMSEDGRLAGGQKVSFCLMDSYHDSLPQPDAHPLSAAGIYQTCSGVVQGISAGWRDEYPYYLVGQQLEIGGIPDGTYALVLEVNPEGGLFETTTADNVAVTIVEISEGGTEAVAR